MIKNLNTTRTRVSAGIASIALTITLAAVGSPPAEAASGTVNCGVYGQVVGVWVDTNGGRDGWAWWRPITGSAYTPNGTAVAYWSFDTQGRTFKLHVGCGGTTRDWRYNIRSRYYSQAHHQIAAWIYGQRYMVPG